jgi:hypothetical protein
MEIGVLARGARILLNGEIKFGPTKSSRVACDQPPREPESAYTSATA